MIDPAIIAAFQVPPPPERPQIVEERAWKSPKAVELERIATRYADGFDQYAEEWLTRVEKAKAEIELASIPYPLPPELLTALEREIADREEAAEARAIQLARTKKRIARDVKRLFGTDPSVAAVMRSLGARLIGTDERLVEGLLDLALFLRALRAEGDPASRGGETFDDSIGLARYLEQFIPA